MPNGIYIQTEYHGKLIRKIVCNGDERWFIGSNCAVTFLSMDDCMAAINCKKGSLPHAVLWGMTCGFLHLYTRFV